MYFANYVLDYGYFFFFIIIYLFIYLFYGGMEATVKPLQGKKNSKIQILIFSLVPAPFRVLKINKINNKIK